MSTETPKPPLRIERVTAQQERFFERTPARPDMLYDGVIRRPTGEPCSDPRREPTEGGNAS